MADYSKRAGTSASSAYPLNQASFTSISSSESGLDPTNTSCDTVDAVPLRIQRMPLLSDDYLKQRQASVENLLSSRTQSNSSSQPSGGYTDADDENPALEPTEKDKLLGPVPSSSFDHPRMSSDPDPHSYFEMEKSGCAGFRNGNSKYLPTPAPRMVSNGLREDSTGTQCHGGGDNLSPKRTNQASNTANHRSQHGENDENTNMTEVDLVANRQPKPSLKEVTRKSDPEQDEERQTSEDRQPRTDVISTPPRNGTNRDHELQVESTSCCDYTCTRLCCALISWETLCAQFSIWDITLTIGSIGIFIFDIVTDLILSLSYYHKIVDNEGYRFYFGLTFGLVIGPSVIIQCFSFFWVVDDFRYRQETNEKNKKSSHREETENLSSMNEKNNKEDNRREETEKSTSMDENNKEGNRKEDTKKSLSMDIFKLFLILILHIFQLAVLFRYVRVIFYGFKSRYHETTRKNDERKRKIYSEHYDTLWRYEVHDINMLRLLESFLESAPQLVLQIYIVVMTKQVQLITVISCIASLLALSTMMVSIQRAIRNSNKEKRQLSIPASIVMFFWRVFTISSRVMAFALFLTIQPLAFLGFILLHWGIATVWIAVKGTTFCNQKKAAEYFFDGICGLIYIFCFFNVHEEKDGKNSRSRWRMLIFYLVVLAENSILSILWYFFRPGGDTRPLTIKYLVEGIWQPDEQNSTPALIPTKSAGIIQPAYALGIIVAVHGFFVLGMVFMIIYYSLLHPKKSTMTCCCFGPQNPRRRHSDTQCGTKLVSAPATRSMLQDMNNSGVHSDFTPTEVPLSTPTLPESSQSYDMQVGNSHSLQRRQEAQQTLRRRQERRMFSGASDTDSDLSTNQMPWSETIFNRDRRAKKLYTRQYSRERELEGTDEIPSQATNNQVKTYSPRQTERFRATVTPTHENRKLILKSPIVGVNTNTETPHSSQSQPSGNLKRTNPKPSAPPHLQSVIIRPGSKGPNPAPRSATHQAFQSYTLASPVRKPARITPPPSLNTSPVHHPNQSAPRPVERRGYSASMSCLVEEKPLSYAARRRKAINCEVPRTPSFTIHKDEVVECMESSV